MDDEKIRLEFAKAFNWYSYESEYGYSKQKKILRTPTWPEIFIEVGKTLERARTLDKENPETVDARDYISSSM